MKRILFILLLLPALVMGQYDFETRYFTMTDESLPEISSFDINFGENLTFEKVSFYNYSKVTVKNYYQPVDMMSALETQTSLLEAPNVNIPKLNQKEFGFSFSVNGNNSREGTLNYGIRNNVYKESRSVFFCAPSSNYYPTKRRSRY
ncbi:MAG: hypothetical protein JKY22_03040 [Flavobacteriaceae bacterium]|nr:hypothetical protein [Flavobacteriaceae bacterium]